MAQHPDESFSTRTGDEFIIRTATREDSSLVLNYLKPIFDSSPYILLTTQEFHFDEKLEADFLDDLYKSKLGIMLIAVKDGKIIGNIDGRARDLKRISHRVSFGMSVLPEYQGQGIGRALLGEFISFTKLNEKIEKIELGVIEKNTSAISLYQSFGFTEEGRSVKGFYSDDGEYLDEIQMGLWVKERRARS
ncbi:MAG: GNAT family N-acetyltransferase [Bdellovibrionales bacterium]|nr:GNAT family N-acetyltransferase [Bdellovibrionales bacterium]